MSTGYLPVEVLDLAAALLWLSCSAKHAKRRIQSTAFEAVSGIKECKFVVSLTNSSSDFFEPQAQQLVLTNENEILGEM